jgi:site-specific DNA-methyltransferase (adenine-specific)
MTNTVNGANMKFGTLAVVGNPPYQTPDAGDSTGAKPLYHLFVESVIDSLNPDYFSFIIPSRWMIGGKGLDKHRERMMNDRHMKKIVHFKNPRDVFPTVGIAGGVNYFMWEKAHNGECEFVNGNSSTKRFLNTHDIILQDNNAFGILEKVQSASNAWISQKCFSSKPFGLRTNFKDFKPSGVKCVCQGKEEKFVDPTAFTDKNGIIGKWKVVTGKVTSEGNIKESVTGSIGVLTNFFVIEPNTICLETYVVANVFDSKQEAEHFVSYMKTKFFRFMLGLRVSGIDINKEKFTWVPDMVDYSAIWMDTDTKTNKGLYSHFGLTRQEIAYIESKIKAI